MSGIFNGDSIYKSGGGGGSSGGYIDGGSLVDSDFMKLENNTYYNYENTSRNYIRFYFENTNDVFNAVVKIDNKNNSTVNVFLYENGIYTPIGFEGNNSLSANKKYVIKIIGKSYIIEEIKDPTAALYYDFGPNGIKAIFKIHNYYWTVDWGGWYTYDQAVSFEIDGWVIPGDSAWNDLTNNVTVDSVRSTSGWDNTQGTNTTGLNFYPYGFQVENYPIWTTYYQGSRSMFFLKNSNYNGASIEENNFSSGSEPGHMSSRRGRVRLVKPV